MTEQKKGVSRRNSLILFVGLILFLSVLSVSNISARVIIVSPANLTNYSSTAMFNVSYNNVTDGITNAVNATFYYNNSAGVWTLIGTVPCLNIAHYNNTCNGTLTTLEIPDGRYTLNVSLNNGTDILTMGTGGVANGNVSTYDVTFDNTPPSVLGYIFTLPNGTFFSTNKMNFSTSQMGYSGVTFNITINVTVNDTLAGVSTVYFNISYSNGTQVNYTVSTSGVANNYTLTVNFSTYDSNAVYYVTAYANDTVGNNNKTEIFQVTLDNTAPTASFACSPSSGTASATINCVCTPADNLVGIDTAQTSYTSRPSVSTIGTFTLNCSYMDFSGNPGSTTVTYTIIAGGSGSAPSSSTTQTTTAEKSNTWAKITSGTPVIMKDFSANSSIKQIEIEVSSNTTNVQLTINEYASKPFNISVSQSNSYKYIHVDALNLASKLSKAIMQIKVEKSWVSQQGIDKANVALFKFDETAQRWNELTTTFSLEDATYYYYDVELNSFSYFAIAPKAVASEGENPVTGEEEITTSSSWVWIMVTLIILAIIAVVAVVFGKKKRK